MRGLCSPQYKSGLTFENVVYSLNSTMFGLPFAGLCKNTATVGGIRRHSKVPGFCPFGIENLQFSHLSGRMIDFIIDLIGNGVFIAILGLIEMMQNLHCCVDIVFFLIAV